MAGTKPGHDSGKKWTFPPYCIRVVNQRISGKDTARGKERTVFRKPATWGGNAIS
jgi:hypothetical protein